MLTSPIETLLTASVLYLLVVAKTVEEERASIAKKINVALIFRINHPP
jgi:hypothetical protein